MGIAAERLFLAAETNPTWADFAAEEAGKQEFAKLDAAVTYAYNSGEAAVFPPQQKLFSAFITPANAVRCVLLGQDPYHANADEAMGLCFSVENGVKCPPSLRNILTEWRADTGLDHANRTDLTPWARNGVLLLNTCLTVYQNQPLSHAAFGWQGFVWDALEYVCRKTPSPFAVFLWGKPAEKFAPAFASRDDLLLLRSPHPSPLSAYRGFFGSRPFTAANAFLQRNGVEPICWEL